LAQFRLGGFFNLVLPDRLKAFFAARAHGSAVSLWHASVPVGSDRFSAQEISIVRAGGGQIFFG